MLTFPSQNHAGPSRPRVSTQEPTADTNGKRRRQEPEDARRVQSRPRGRAPDTESGDEDGDQDEEQGSDDPLGVASHMLMNEIIALDPDRRLILPITSGLTTETTSPVEANLIGMLEKYELALVVIRQRDSQLKDLETQLRHCEQKLAYTRAYLNSMESMYRAFGLSHLYNNKDKPPSDAFRRDFRILAELVGMESSLVEMVERGDSFYKDKQPTVPPPSRATLEENVAREIDMVGASLSQAANIVADNLIKDAYELNQKADHRNHQADERYEKAALRHQQADERYRQADERHKLADQRHSLADERYRQADERYRRADERYARADQRYESADKREKAWELRIRAANDQMIKAESLSSEAQARIKSANERADAAERSAAVVKARIERLREYLGDGRRGAGQ